MAKSAQRCSSDKSRRQRRRRQCVAAAAAALVANVAAAAAELQMLSFFFGVHGHQQLVCDSHTHTYTHTNRLNISMSHLVVVAGRRRQRLISTTLFCSLSALLCFSFSPSLVASLPDRSVDIGTSFTPASNFLFLSLYTQAVNETQTHTHFFCFK